MDNPDAAYQQQAIQKYLNENVNTNPFVSIFNGKDLTGWKGLVANPIKRVQMSAKELAAAQEIADKAAAESWVVKDGMIFFTGKGKTYVLKSIMVILRCGLTGNFFQEKSRMQVFI